MVNRKAVPSLQNISLQSLQKSIHVMCSTIFADQFSTLDGLAYWSEVLIEHINNEIMWLLHDQIAWHILRAADKFFIYLKSKFSSAHAQPNWFYCKGIAMIRLIVAIVPYLKIRSLKLGEWSMPIQSLLVQLLHKATDLRTFDTRCLLKSTEPDQFSSKLLKSFGALTNLTTFNMTVTCTDEILAGLSEHCKLIRKVLVSLSRGVTDLGCESLQELGRLEEVDLSATAVTAVGYGKLLTKSKSKNLFDIGHCLGFSFILDLLEKKPVREFPLRRLQCYDLDTHHLSVLYKYFPFLNEFIGTYESVSPNVDCLWRLEQLSRIKIRRPFPKETVFCNPLSRFLSTNGASIKSLSLGGVNGMVISNILDIAQSCPNLESLEIDQCSFSDEGVFPEGEILPEPFQNLIKFHWSLNTSLNHASLVLRYALNIKVLVIKPGDLSIDNFLGNVLNHNPLKELRELRVENKNNMSPNLLEFIALKCRNISVIGNFMYSKTIPKTTLKKIQDLYNKHNYNFTLA